MALMGSYVPAAMARDLSKDLHETTIIVGSEIDYPPYALVDEHGNADGFSVDLIKAAAKDMGLKVKFVVGPWNKVKKMLESGEIDVLPLVSYSEEWDAVFDYTKPHTISHSVVFMRKGTSAIESLDNIKGKEIILMKDDFDESLIDQYRGAGKLFYTDTMEEAFQLLASGKHDVLIAPELVGHFIVNKLNLTNITHLTEPLDTYGKGFAFAVKQGDTELLNHLEQGLMLVKQDGEYDKIYDKWFGLPLTHEADYKKYIDNLIVAGLIIVLLVVFGIVWNATLRREVRKQTSALIESEERFRLLIENASDGIFIADIQGRYTDVNHAGCSMLGFARSEIIGKTIMDFIPPEDVQRLAKSKDEMLNGGSQISEWNLLCKDGTYLPVEVSASILPNKQWQAFVRDISERKEADKKLKYNEQRFRDISEAAGEYVWEVDADMVYTYVSEQSKQAKGYAPKALLGHTPMEFMQEEDIEQVGKIVNDAIARKTSFKLIHRDITPSGDIFWLEVSGTPIYDEADNVIGLRGTGLNITPRIEAEKKLRESRQRFSATFNQAAIGLALLGLDGSWLRVNAALSHIVGYSKEELIKLTFQDITYPDDLETDLHFVQQMLSGEIKTYATEKRYIHKNGHLVWSNVTVSLVFKDNGDPDYFISAVEDISSRKQTDEKIHKLSQAVMQSGEGVVIANAAGIIEYVNPAFTAITGYSEIEAIGHNPNILKSGNQNAYFYKAMWATLNAGEPWQGKVVNKKKTGEFYPAMLTISPIKNQAGDITNFIGLQQSLEAYEALEAQFHQSQKMEAIGTLVGGIAHDFNNLLAGMTGNIYLAKKRSENNPDVLKKLLTVEQLSYRAAELIKQLLTFARKGIIDMQPLLLTPFIKETLKLLRTSIPENIALNHDVCSDALVINGDATQLHQVLMNLVNNARDAVEDVDKPCISVKLDSIYSDYSFCKKHPGMNAETHYAYLSIEDNGCGIPKDQIEHLFEPFFTTKAQGKGTGLGLAMVFGAVKTHGGHIEVESREGEGTAFHVYLPLLETETIPDMTLADDEALTSGTGELILFVDDDEDVQAAGESILESLGYRVLKASNGLDAIDVFIEHQNQISLVITDVVMPELGGVDAIERMKEIHPNIKVIFLTGYDQGAIASSDRPSSEYIVLSKPFNINSLSGAIRKQLDT